MTWARLPLTGLICLFLLNTPSYGGQGAPTQWLSESKALLTVRYHPGNERLAGQVLDHAEIFLGKASNFVGLEADRQYSIVIASSKEEFVSLQPTRSSAPEWAGALTYPDLDLVLIMTPGALESDGSDYWSLLQHEMVHLIIGGAELESHTRLPRWFQEGIATYVSGEMNFARLLHLGWAQITGSTPSFRELDQDFPQQASRAEVAYARSFLFIRYLTSRFGTGAVSALVRQSLLSGNLDEGSRVVFGIPLEEILQGFDQYARIKATWIPILGSAATIWAAITFLFLLTWYRKRVLGLRTLRRWEEEEKWFYEDHEQSDEEKHILH